ncbi:NAD(P)-binding protein [Hesseltinella vesiculosa]|uniref:NAD(P)-binding protein n=1 Tax=Hesseltinella vesiculosa TaxID=101127 RepID=A0A1X2GWR4_9FUNG|nr:NAD(P)-binding protein [Hesseltinella vesiculosa]
MTNFQPPVTFRKIQAIQVGNDFEKVTRVVNVNYQDFASHLRPHQVIVKMLYVGINASDVNYTNAKYVPDIKPPFDVGFEGLGQVVAVGEKVNKAKLGSYAIVSQYGAFAEYIAVAAKVLVPVPAPKPELVSLFVSGLTASIALTEKGQLGAGETVLVTAAAGGTGQFAVQLAKLAGNHVIGTCSSDEKVAMLKRMGCDRVINYKKEDLKTVLRKEYPRGVDIVYESVGGEFFNICLNSLADKGRLIVIGMAASYTSSDGMKGDDVNTIKLLAKSRTVTGFFLPAYAEQQPKHLKKLIELLNAKKLEVELDVVGQGDITDVYAGVDHLQKGHNKGKVVVPLVKSDARL